MHSKELLYHIEKWLREKERLIYKPAGEIELEWRPTDRWMTPQEAAAGRFAPLPPDGRWGEKWGYAWFRGVAVMPEAARGRRVELELNVGAESTIFVNGRAAGSKDWQHARLTLTRQAVPGEAFPILAEAYAGHDRELPTAGRTRLVIVNEAAYQFFIDLNALYQLRMGLDPASLRVAEIDAGFRRLIAALDWEPEDGELEREAARGRAILRPLLDCVNGSTAPKLYLMGQSHLDIAWLWPIEETKRKIARTMSNQLALLEEYPEYRYTQSQPYLFQLVKELYPELYGRIREMVAQGKIIPEGGAWVEPDTNIPSGESLIRQFLHGKRFFREEFGVDNRMLWLPDVFGYSGNLPQIMKGCGIDYFASVKMFQTYDNVADPFPYNTFVWEGIDGSEVAVHLLDYGPFPNPADVKYALFQWNERIQQEGVATRLVQFGYGDGGGGANRDDLESIRRMKDLEGAPRTVIASPLEYFADLEARGLPPEARYVGELYYPAHRGTLTSQAKMKAGNRKAEFALREAELWSAFAALTGRSAYPGAELADAWRKLLLLQFHDILPGTSIQRVHEEAERDFAEVLATAERLAEQAAGALTDGAEEAGGAAYFNSMPWERTAIVALPAGCEGARLPGGEPLTVQERDGRRYVRVSLPAMGAITLELAAAAASAEASGKGAGTEAEASGKDKATATEATRNDAGGAQAVGGRAGFGGDALRETVAAAGPVAARGDSGGGMGAAAGGAPACPRSGGLRATARSLENEHLRVALNEYGEIVELYDKETDSPWLSGRGNRLRMFRDQTSNYDAWEIDRRYADAEIALPAAATVTVAAEGPLLAAVRIERELNRSILVQEIRLEAGSRTVEFHTRIHWREQHKLLKASFDVGLRASELISEIQFGYMKRPTHRSRPHDADRFEVSQLKWSALAEGDRCFSLLNDGKYGVSALGGQLELTLLTAPTYPDERADGGWHEFRYAVHVWNGGFHDSPVIRAAYELNRPVLSLPGRSALPAGGLLACDRANIVVDTVKLAEDGSGDWIARLYEGKGAATRCELRVGIPFAQARVTDMLEERTLAQPARTASGEGLLLAFGPFEVKTVRFSAGTLR